MDTNTALETEPETREVHIEEGEEAYNRIEVQLGVEDGVLFLEYVTPGDEAAVQIKGELDARALELTVYCPRTTFFISPPTGSSFLSADPSAGPLLPASAELISYTATVDPDGALSIDSENNYRVSDPASATEEKTAKAGLKVADSSGRSIPIVLVAPPFRWVEVDFNADATPAITYGPGSDFSSVAGDCPEIRMPQDGGIVFLLVSQQEGARFADPPFDPPPPPDWIIDVGTDGQHAFLANLHPDDDPAADSAPTEYGFRVRVSYGGRDWESGDPTIVNVDPSPPRHPEEAGRGAQVRSAGA